jgi:hypothetical protein
MMEIKSMETDAQVPAKLSRDLFAVVVCQLILILVTVLAEMALKLQANNAILE